MSSGASSAPDWSIPTTASGFLLDQVDYPSWAETFSKQRNFYVAGLSELTRLWPRLNSNGSFVRDVAAQRLRARDFFTNTPELRDELRNNLGEGDLSLNQIHRAKDGKPLNLLRAIEVSLAIEFALEQYGLTDSSREEGNALDIRRIRPAIFVVRGFEEWTLEAIRSREGQSARELLSYIEQDDAKLLDDMAAGHTVSLRTASLLAEFAQLRLPHYSIGSVSSALERSDSVLAASLRERVPLKMAPPRDFPTDPDGNDPYKPRPNPSPPEELPSRELAPRDRRRRLR